MPVMQFEKMDADRPGEPGGHGEYKVQTGFGWSNGVVLQLLLLYGWRPEVLQESKPWLPKVGPARCHPAAGALLALCDVISTGQKWQAAGSCTQVQNNTQQRSSAKLSQ